MFEYVFKLIGPFFQQSLAQELTELQPVVCDDSPQKIVKTSEDWLHLNSGLLAHQCKIKCLLWYSSAKCFYCVPGQQAKLEHLASEQGLLLITHINNMLLGPIRRQT